MFMNIVIKESSKVATMVTDLRQPSFEPHFAALWFISAEITFSNRSNEYENALELKF